MVDTETRPFRNGFSSQDLWIGNDTAHDRYLRSEHRGHRQPLRSSFMPPVLPARRHGASHQESAAPRPASVVEAGAGERGEQLAGAPAVVGCQGPKTCVDALRYNARPTRAGYLAGAGLSAESESL